MIGKQLQRRGTNGGSLSLGRILPPEQCRGASNVGDRADVYSLGVITYQMLTGRLPFLSDGEGAVLAMHIYEPPQPPRALVPSITEGMQELVLAMLSKEPIGRPSMLHVHRRLEEMGAAYGMNQDLSMTFEEAPPTGKVPEPSTVLSGVLPTVNLHSNPPSQPSTLGQGTGQLDQPSDPVSHVVTRRPLLAGAALAGLMVLGAVGAIAFKLTRQIPVATAEKEGTAASAPTESTGHSEDPQAAGSTTPTATPPPVAETPKPAPAAGKPKPVASKGVKKLQRGKPQKGKKGAKKKAGKGKGKAVKGKPAKPSGPTKIVD